MNSQISNIDRYSTFGLREQWLKAFIQNQDNWDSGLGNKQVAALKRWYAESELISPKQEISDLTKVIKRLPIEDIWGIVWINLTYNSGIIAWYHKIAYSQWQRSVLFNLLKQDYPVYSEGTLNNAFSALLNLLDCSDIIARLYGQGHTVKKGKSIIEITKQNRNPISNVVMLYCLYKHAEIYTAYHTTVSELFHDLTLHTPKNIFGVDRIVFMNQLLGLQEHKSRLVRVEFNANLDNIFLNKDHTALSAIKTYLEG